MTKEKTDLTKFEKIRKEANRIKKIFKELDENNELYFIHYFFIFL